MSTKIYNARRLKKGVLLWPYVGAVRLAAERRIRQTLRQFYRGQVERIGAMTPKRRADHLKRLGIEGFSVVELSGWLFREFHTEAGRGTNDTFNMSVAVVFREHAGRIYLIPYASGIMCRALDFLKRDRLSEDYHYQNQVDQSAPCSRKAWEERERIWDAILDNGRERDALVLEILCPGNFLNMHLDSRGRYMRVGPKP